MSRLREAMEKYKNTGNNDFFFLQNDKDTAMVRFLYHGTGDAAEQDLDWYVVHEAQIGGKKRWVKCPETPQCPFCIGGDTPKLKAFLQLIDYRDGKIKTWERGQQFIGKLISFMERYGELYQRKYEIQRNGVPKDPKTTYELFALDPDGADWNELQSKRQVLVGERGFILERGIEDMQRMFNGTFEFEKVEGVRERPSHQNQPRNEPPQQYSNQQYPPQPQHQPQQPYQHQGQQQGYQQPPSQGYPGGPFNNNNVQPQGNPQQGYNPVQNNGVQWQQPQQQGYDQGQPQGQPQGQQGKPQKGSNIF